MCSPFRLLWLCLALALLVPLTAACTGIGDSAPGEARVLRMILVPADASDLDPSTPDGLRRLSAISGVELVHIRSLASAGHVLVTEQALPPGESRRVMERLAADPSVAVVEEDRRVMP